MQAVHIPFSNKNQYFEAYKQARRREDDIAIVNAAVNVTFLENSDEIAQASFGFGGMSFKTLTAPITEQYLKGKPKNLCVTTTKPLSGKRWTKQTLEDAYSVLLQDLPMDPSAPGGMVRYRQSLALSLVTKAFINVSEKLHKKLIFGPIEAKETGGGEGLREVEQKSSQYFNVVPGNGKKYDTVARPIGKLVSR